MVKFMGVEIDMLDYQDIRNDIIVDLDEYVRLHQPVGGFLMACLENDLVGAVSKADDYNVQVLPAIVKFLYNKVPGGCWGSKEIVDKWLSKGGENRG